MVVRITGSFLGIACTDEHKCAGNPPGKLREILSDHFLECGNMVRTYQILYNGLQVLHHLRVVEYR